MTELKQIVILCFTLAGIALPAFSGNLPAQVQQALKQAGIPESAVGIYVHEIGATQPILAINADEAMNPASVMKLVTTFAGLELLGPAYTWETAIYAHGKLENGVLQGDLVIKGYGDPKLDLENFWLLIHRLRQTGLHEITGDLILDHTHYDIPSDDPGAFDGQPYRTYNILPEALLVNYRTSALHLTPQPENNTVRLVVDPLPDSLLLKNNLKLTRGDCGDWRSLLDTEIHPDENGRLSVSLKGSYSVNCGKKSHFLGLHDSSTYTRDLFQRLWAQQGGIFQGKVLIGTAPEGILPLKIYQSPPLTEVVRGINKFSNNIAARQLYLTLGTAKAPAHSKSPVTLAKSDIAIRQWLASRQMIFPELVVENGSGLSRNERISANHMGKFLLAAFQSSVMPEFISSMPIAAVDGTMRNRLSGTPVSGLAHLKTGALWDVSALAGYMLNKSGRRIVVVFFVNHARSDAARPVMDRLLQWLYAGSS
ncbi:MAG: D-alanyl-D-alanine carboxypeptidase/D-alanyl-D-alanine-endopeptidase [Nitrosomonas sp.]|nr:D-alanyl-D-alanine carboxypeptidase/D-alanyl-D-alanine-endopeptidase [Nitrosomonas sp.]